MTRKTQAWILCAGALALGGCRWFHWPGSHGGGHGHGHPRPDAGGGGSCSEDQFESADGSCVRMATAIAVGSNHSCAVLAGGGLKCWGSNGWYKLGYGPGVDQRGDHPEDMGEGLPFVPVDGPSAILSLSAGSWGTCVSFEAGGAKCWGYNGYGMVLGNLMPASVSDPVDALPVHALPDGLSAPFMIASGGEFYALLDDGRTVISQAGSPLNYVDWSLPGEVAIHFDSTPAYGSTTCVVFEDGSVACGSRTDVDPTGFPLDGAHAVQVAVGDAHQCIRLEDGTVQCWGDNTFGQLGVGDTTSYVTPQTVPLGAGATWITAGPAHTCAILDGGSVKCWGRNDTGQLGVGSTEQLGDAPGELASLAQVDLGTGAVAVALEAAAHTCALLESGAVKCWGANDVGQLGQGDTSPRGAAAGEMGDMLPPIDLGT